MEKCLFSATVGVFAFMVKKNKVLFLICTSTWRANIYVSYQGKDINRRNESKMIIIIIAIDIFVIQLNVVDWKLFPLKESYILSRLGVLK